jgi:hypothetical protein
LNANVSHGFLLHAHDAIDAHCLGTRPCLPRQPSLRTNGTIIVNR